MLSCTSASPDVSFTPTPGYTLHAVKHGSLCLHCPSAESHPALRAQLNVHILEKGFSALRGHGHSSLQVIADPPGPAPPVLAPATPPSSGVICPHSSGSFWIGSLLRAEPPSPLWPPRLRCHPQGLRKEGSWGALWGASSLPGFCLPSPSPPPSWSLRCLGPFCLTGPEGELLFP